MSTEPLRSFPGYPGQVSALRRGLVAGLAGSLSSLPPAAVAAPTRGSGTTRTSRALVVSPLGLEGEAPGCWVNPGSCAR